MDKRGKKVKAEKLPAAAARIPKRSSDLVVDVDVDQWNSPPCWNYRYIDNAHFGAWDWRLSDAEQLQLWDFLKQMQGLSWKEIRNQTHGGHFKHHDMAAEVLADEAKERLWELKLGELEQVFRFRLQGKVRLWGAFIGKGHEFYLLWWDRDHAVYPTDVD